jgi:hypothetical protein
MLFSSAFLKLKKVEKILKIDSHLKGGSLKQIMLYQPIYF